MYTEKYQFKIYLYATYHGTGKNSCKTFKSLGKKNFSCKKSSSMQFLSIICVNFSYSPLIFVVVNDVSIDNKYNWWVPDRYIYFFIQTAMWVVQ